MTINQHVFQNNFKQTKANDGVDIDLVQKYLKNSIYHEDSVLLNPFSSTQQELSAVQKQVDILCNKMINDVGLGQFSNVKKLFAIDLGSTKKDRVVNLNNTKATLEAIVYTALNSPEKIEQIRNNFNDIEIACGEGTLSNLQNMLSSLTLDDKGIDAYIMDQKDVMLTNIITEMYNKGKFFEFPWVYKHFFRDMEIHNITALKNKIADDYGLLKKSAQEDKYLKRIIVLDSSRQKILKEIDKKTHDSNVVDSMIDGITNNIMVHLPIMPDFNDVDTQLSDEEKQKSMNQYATRYVDFLQKLNIASFNDAYGAKVPNEFTFFQSDGVGTFSDLKHNIQELVRDVVVLTLQEKNVIQINDNDLQKSKLRLELNSTMDENSKQAVGKETIDSLQHSELKEYAYKYIIDHNMQLDQDEFGMSDPVEYCMQNDINIYGTSAKNYKLDKIIDEYLKLGDGDNDLRKKEALNEEYYRVHNLGSNKRVELISIHSSFGKLIQEGCDVPKIFSEYKALTGRSIDAALIDYRMCDLEFIKECKEIMKDAGKEHIRDYTKFSPFQKAVTAASMLLGPVGFVVKHYISKRNQKKLEELSLRVSGIVDQYTDVKDTIDALQKYKSHAKEEVPQNKKWLDEIIKNKESHSRPQYRTR